MSLVGQSRHFARAPLTSGLPRLADILRVIRHVSKVPTCDIERAGRPKEKAAGRRLSISILINVDQAAINAGFDFRRWAALADNDF
jgi:hypothetical protein